VKLSPKDRSRSLEGSSKVEEAVQLVVVASSSPYMEYIVNMVVSAELRSLSTEDDELRSTEDRVDDGDDLGNGVGSARVFDDETSIK